MDYEQKYKAALERAREYWENDNDNTLDIKAKKTMEYLFPELAESEDEKIRKGLIEDYKKFNPMDEYLDGVPFSHVVTWLEKQGQKPALKESDETAEAFARIIRAHLIGIDSDVQYEFEQLYKEITGKKMYQGYKD